MGAVVHPADIRDRDGAAALPVSIRHRFPWRRHIFADARAWSRAGPASAGGGCGSPATGCAASGASASPNIWGGWRGSHCAPARPCRSTTPAGRLAALSGACATCDALLPEGAPHPALFRGLAALLDALEEPDPETGIWAAAHVAWEVGLLAELGFALDLERCAATGSRDDLRWVSPRAGRAVSVAAGAPTSRRARPPGSIGWNAGSPNRRANSCKGARIVRRNGLTLSTTSCRPTARQGGLTVNLRRSDVRYSLPE